MGFPSCSDGRWYRICLQCWRPEFHPWVGKIPWRREWQPTSVFFLGEFHGQRSLAGYSPKKKKKLDMTEQTSLQWLLLGFKNEMQEELRWQRNRMRRPLSPIQIHQMNIWTLSKLHKEWNAEKGSSLPVLHVGIHFFFFLEHILFLELGKMLNFNIMLKSGN